METRNQLNVPHRTELEIYYETLLKWQRSINLISQSTLKNAWQRHFLDSLELLSFIPSKAKTIIDLGSGAGFPGLVICIGTEIPTLLIEADRKKCEFLREVIRLTNANAMIENGRIETYHGAPVDVIVCRALAPLSQILGYSKHLIREDGCLLFLKGERLNIEIAEAQKKWHFKYEIHETQTSSTGKIIKVWDLDDKGIRNR